MFISKKDHRLLIKYIGFDDTIVQDANYRAWDELSDEQQELIDKADRADDKFSIGDIEIEWDSYAGNKNQVGLKTNTSVHRSSSVPEDKPTNSELYRALQEYGSRWAKAEMEMMKDRIIEEIEQIEEETRLSRREAEVYFYTEKLGFSQRETAEQLGISKGNVAKVRNGQIREKIEQAERTAQLELK